LLGFFFDCEGGGDMFLRNVGWLPTDYTGLYPRRNNFSSVRSAFICYQVDIILLAKRSLFSFPVLQCRFARFLWFILWCYQNLRLYGVEC
jgi:hypothetical protein